jgi:hypothetical protein
MEIREEQKASMPYVVCARERRMIWIPLALPFDTTLTTFTETPSFFTKWCSNYYTVVLQIKGWLI